MADLFYLGGPIWMGILTMILLTVIALYIYKWINVDKTESGPEQFAVIKDIGLFALVAGIFFQLISLYEALVVIEIAASVSGSVLANGLKVSMLTTMYGMAIYLMSLGLYILTFAYFKKQE